MLVKIAKEILDKYPHTEIAYVVAKLNVKATDDHTESLKASITNSLNERNITKDTYATHDQIQGWRSVYKDFGISHKSKVCSLEALVKRIVSGKSMWNVSNAVDLYNCISVLTMVPMGAYDIDMIKENIHIRYGKAGEVFDPLGSNDKVIVEEKHVVYSDEEKVITWLWNYRDSKITSISESTKHAIFFLDTAFRMKHIKMKEAALLFEESLMKIGAEITSDGILSKANPQVDISFDKPIRALNINSIEGSSEPTYVEQSSVENGNINYQHFQQALHCAATGDLKRLKEILEITPSLISCKDWTGSTLMAHAAIGDHDDVLSFLLASTSKANIKQKNNVGQDLLDIASRSKSKKCLKVLSGN